MNTSLQGDSSQLVTVLTPLGPTWMQLLAPSRRLCAAHPRPRRRDAPCHARAEAGAHTSVTQCRYILPSQVRQLPVHDCDAAEGAAARPRHRPGAAMICYAMTAPPPRYPYAMLCCAMLCYAMLCYAMLCYAMLCYRSPAAGVQRPAARLHGRKVRGGQHSTACRMA